MAIDAVKGSSYTLQVVGGANDYFAARQPLTLTATKLAVSIPTVAKPPRQPPSTPPLPPDQRVRGAPAQRGQQAQRAYCRPQGSPGH